MLIKAIREALELNDKEESEREKNLYSVSRALNEAREAASASPAFRAAEAAKNNPLKPQPCPECEKLRERTRTDYELISSLTGDLRKKDSQINRLAEALCEAVKR